MKNYLLLLLSIFILEANSQITKDYSYITSLLEYNDGGLKLPKVLMVYNTLPNESNVQNYAVYDKQDEWIKIANGKDCSLNGALLSIYNLDHSVYKEIEVYPPLSLEIDSVEFTTTQTTWGDKPTNSDSVWVNYAFENDTSWGYTITVKMAALFVSSEPLALSTNLFNTDSKIEFLVSWTILTPNVSEDGTLNNFTRTDSLYLYSENGEILYNFGSSAFEFNYDFEYDKYMEYYFKVTDNGYVFMMPTDYEDYTIDSYGNTVDGDDAFVFYSLGGGKDYTSNNTEASARSIKVKPAFPNPTKEILTIPYELNNSEKVNLTVYSADGSVITTKVIDNRFNNLKLDVSSYSKGIYIYKYNNVSESFIVK